MSTWKSLAKKSNSLPPGWSSAEDIAADLDCEPNEVPKILAASIRDGLVEKQNFPHWQPGSRQLLYQTGYRQLDKQPEPKVKEKPTKNSVKTKKQPAVTAIPGIPAHLLERVTQTCLRYAAYSPAHIADRCRWANEPRIKAPAIRALLDKLSHN
jgi:hypothetical protein